MLIYPATDINVRLIHDANRHVFQLFIRTVLNHTKLVYEQVEFTGSTQTVLVPLTCTVTKQQPVGGGQCSKRDWMARLISTAAGTTTKKDSEI